MWKRIMSEMPMLLSEVPMLLMVGLLVLALYASDRKYRSAKQEAQKLENTISLQNQQIKQIQITLNDTVLLYQAQIENLNYTKKNLEARYGDLLKASKTKVKDVNSMSTVSSVIKDSVIVPVLVDTFSGIKAHYKDEFARIDVEIKTDRNAIIDYEMRDSLTIINVQQKKSYLFGLIKKTKHKETKVINHNPKGLVVSLETINVIE